MPLKHASSFTMRSVTHQNVTWLDYANPHEEDLRALQQKYRFHELDIEDTLSERERPKIEEYDDYLFILLHVPYVAKGSERIIKEDVSVFLGKEFIVTVHSDRLPIFDTLFETLSTSLQQREEYFQKGPSLFLYELLEKLFEGGFPIIDRVKRKLKSLERELFESEEEVDVLREILSLKYNIITMRSILLPQRTLLAMLEQKHRAFIPDELDIYFGDILDAIERQYALLDTARDLSEALEETHESLLSHRTNTVIRILTVFSVTMLPLTFLTGLYGMNVPLPFQGHPWSFLLLLGVMVTVLVSTVGYFAWKRWL